MLIQSILKQQNQVQIAKLKNLNTRFTFKNILLH